MQRTIDKLARSLLRRSPRGLKSALDSISFRMHFSRVAAAELDKTSAALGVAWEDADIPARQRILVDQQLAAYHSGQPNPPFDTLVNLLRHNLGGCAGMSLLEIGCSSGYYSEVLRARGINAAYTGCDVSRAFIDLASRTYPGVSFAVEDATRLSYPAKKFDIVVSGCCLLHIRRYEVAIAEASRVARHFVVFHRTPVLHLQGPLFFTKKAYGVKTLEIHFNEQQLVRMFAANDLDLIDIDTHAVIRHLHACEPLFYKSYLCRRRA